MREVKEAELALLKEMYDRFINKGNVLFTRLELYDWITERMFPLQKEVSELQKKRR